MSGMGKVYHSISDVNFFATPKKSKNFFGLIEKAERKFLIQFKKNLSQVRNFEEVNEANNN